MKRSHLLWISVWIWFLSTLYLLVGAILFNRVSHESMLLIFSSQLLQMGVILPCALSIFPRYWKKEKVISLFGSLVGLVLLFVVTRFLLEEVLFVRWFGFAKNEQLNIFFFFYENFYYSIPAVFIGLIIYLLSKSYYAEERNLRLAEDLKQSELLFLKSQLNPHFLYNTLNYLYAMALPVPGNLSRAIMKLSKILQYTLDKNRKELVPLQEEIKFIEDYLSLYAFRYSPNFHYKFSVEGNTDDIQLPPLLLLPFIENIIKHGETTDANIPAVIEVEVTHSGLILKVSNKINGQSNKESTGIGLENVKRRLDLLLPNRHTLVLDNNDKMFRSTLTIAL